MKSIWKLAPWTVAVGAAFWLGNVIAADSPTTSTEPGSIDDPLITKSYLEKRLQDLSVNPGVNPGSNSGSQNPAPAPSGGASEKNKLIVIKLEPGQTLYGGQGTEFIVRTGKAVAVSSDANGIPDVTAGKDLANGQPVPLNHLLVFPRDGRGITYAKGTTSPIYVMVRGAFLLLDKDGKQATPTID